jgi:hypothetical protein
VDSLPGWTDGHEPFVPRHGTRADVEVDCTGSIPERRAIGGRHTMLVIQFVRDIERVSSRAVAVSTSREAFPPPTIGVRACVFFLSKEDQREKIVSAAIALGGDES